MTTPRYSVRRGSLPVPSFRTDTWDWPEAPFDPQARGEFDRRRGEMRWEAEQQNRQRRLEEARVLLKRLEAQP